MRIHSSLALLLVALLSRVVGGFSRGVLPQQKAFLTSNATPARRRSEPLPIRRDARVGADTVPAVRGGNSASPSPGGEDLDLSAGNVVASLWGTVGVAGILLKAIVRVAPVALEPFGKGEGVVPLTRPQLLAYAAVCASFAYAEGYRGFQRKFSPLVVSRSFTLRPSESRPLHVMLAPLYSMGLFHATRKRVIVSWSVTLGVAVVVAAVKRLPYPWRSVVDAGVVVGLTWGTVSILGGYALSLVTGIAPFQDPSLPEKSGEERVRSRQAVPES